MPPRKKQRIVPAGNVAAAAAASVRPTSAAVPLSRRYSLRLHPPQPHHKLHRHALESIFGFLSFDELRSSMFVSRRWIEAVYSMRGLEDGRQLDLRTFDEFSVVLPSRLARHVTSIFESNGRAPITLSQEQLQQIAVRMPFLRDLRFAPLPADDWSAGVRFPPTLHTIHLHIDPRSTPAPSINALLSTISQHQPLVHLDITLVRGSVIPRDMSFAPLQALPMLKSLRVDINHQTDMTTAQVNELRTLTQLEILVIWCDESTLLRLLEPPYNSRLQWKSLPFYGPFTDAGVALLPSLPRLEKLSFRKLPVELSSLDFLAQLPHLTALEVSSIIPPDWKRTAVMLLALSVSLPRVTHLKVEFWKVSTPALRHLMAYLPNLREVDLRYLYHVDDLTFLEPVRGSLRKLTLASCLGDLPFDALRALSSFSLTHLKLEDTLAPSLRDPARLASLTPPSSLIPTLQVFEHRS